MLRLWPAVLEVPSTESTFPHLLDMLPWEPHAQEFLRFRILFQRSMAEPLGSQELFVHMRFPLMASPCLCSWGHVIGLQEDSLRYKYVASWASGDARPWQDPILGSRYIDGNHQLFPRLNLFSTSGIENSVWRIIYVRVHFYVPRF